MITLVIPTFNRAHTLALTLPSLISQEKVDEVVFVIDASTDGTAALLSEAAGCLPESRIRILSHPRRLGAAACRNHGAAAARNDYVLFCDDDEILGDGYAAACHETLIRLNAGAVAGRQIYLRNRETPEQARKRFGDGLKKGPIFSPLICEHVVAAQFEGERKIPFTHSIILTRKALLMRFPFDDHYSQGNGYREETDYQMNLFLDGQPIYVTNAAHVYHLPPRVVRSGGQSVPQLVSLYWMIRYTHYFLENIISAMPPEWAFAIHGTSLSRRSPPLPVTGRWSEGRSAERIFS